MSTELTKSKLLALSRGSKWAVGIKLLRSELGKKRHSSERRFLLLNLAAFLYHNSFTKNRYGINKNNDLKEAIKICRDIIKDNKNLSSTNMLDLMNARFFLAQILAASGDVNAIKLAKDSFDMQKNSVSANRLANVYEMLGNKKMAEKYYLEHEKIAAKNREDMLYVYLSMYIYYIDSKSPEKAQRYLNMIEKNKSHLSYKQVKKILADYGMKRSQP